MAMLPSKAFLAMAGTAAMKARDYASRNPDKVDQALGRVQSTVSRRTGGKYDAHLSKGRDAVRKGLGLHGRPGEGPPPPADPR